MQEKDAVNLRIVPRAQPGESNMPQAALSLHELAPSKWTQLQTRVKCMQRWGAPLHKTEQE